MRCTRDLYDLAPHKSSSESSTSQQVEQTDKRIGASDQAVVVQLETGASLNLTDPGVVEVLSGSFSLIERALEDALTFAGRQNEKAAQLTEEVLNRARTEQAQFFDNLLKWGTALTVGVVVAINAPRLVRR